LLRFIYQKNANAAMSVAPTTPPTTPPAIAPALVFDEWEEPDVDFDADAEPVADATADDSGPPAFSAAETLKLPLVADTLR